MGETNEGVLRVVNLGVSERHEEAIRDELDVPVGRSVRSKSNGENTRKDGLRKKKKKRLTGT